MRALLGLQTSRLESVAQFFTVILVFVLVLALTYFTTRFVGSYQKTQMTCRNLEVIETCKLTSNKYVQIIRVGDKYMSIAVCKDTVTFLTEVSAEELDMTPAGKPTAESFQEVLTKAKNLLHKGK